MSNPRSFAVGTLGQRLVRRLPIIYHLSKARRKLDAANSRHAISKAFSLKLIALD